MNHLFRKTSAAIITAFMISTLLLSGCSQKLAAVDPTIRTDFLMGTVCKVTVYDKCTTEIMDKVFNRLSEIEGRMTINSEKSELIDIAKNAGIKPIKVTDDVFFVIKKAISYSVLTNGDFDVSIGPLVKLWGIGTDAARLPSQVEIDSKKVLTNYKKIILDEKNKTVMLQDKNMIIDLGAIAKGYAADEAARILKENGIKHAIVDLGGDLVVVNGNVDGTPWKIGVQSPFQDRGTSIGTMSETNKAVVTSGIYERYFEKDGKIYHHILNPFTGYPYENNIAGVSIICDNSTDGDGLSTSFFELGVDKGLAAAKNIKGVEAIFITKNKEVYITPGLKGNFKLTDSSYTLKN